ncbi:hypothetical protein [Streptomyces sp. CB03238]|uniref:hypothetical protein n=1 Tax=Streptomyces sp. CB03238 TaxID=1907777 RepID=UPI000A11D6AE|nr:hypothetical protein [Streptomyces sp. CB03238]ORT55621.1 hypothetical protein BKD26_31435 [Streptomyces sp. CB03238]
MRNHLAKQVRQVPVTDPIATARRYDYADAFELLLPGPDPLSPETWVRSGLGATATWVDWVAGLLGMRGAAGEAADHVGDFRVTESGPEVVRLETSLPLMHVILVGRRVEPTRRLFTSVLHYRRPVLARLVWAVVGIGHRRAARQLVTSGMVTK